MTPGPWPRSLATDSTGIGGQSALPDHRAQHPEPAPIGRATTDGSPVPDHA